MRAFREALRWNAVLAVRERFGEDSAGCYTVYGEHAFRVFVEQGPCY